MYSRMDLVNFLIGCLPQILLDPFLNTLTHITIMTIRGHYYYLPLAYYLQPAHALQRRGEK